MAKFTMDFSKSIISIAYELARGKVWIMPTDTIYGIVGSALKPRTVGRIYRLRKRNQKKPMIILISALRDLHFFGIKPDVATRKLLSRFWPGPVSIILPLPKNKATLKTFRYLHRGTNALAFRLPKPIWLRKILKNTGPLVAPSANWEGHPPAKTIAEAERYFKDRIDGYFDRGPHRGKPSKLVRVEKGKAVVMRA